MTTLTMPAPAVSILTTDGISVARYTRVAASFGARFIGLLNRKELHREEGLLISPGGSIHTCGMRFAIDVLFLDRTLRVLKAAHRISPWRGRLAPAGTHHVLELCAGRIRELQLQVGSQLIRR